MAREDHPYDSDSNEPARKQRDLEVRLDVVTTLLLAAAALGSAWSAYQASRWSGEQAHHYNDASALREESLRSSDRAAQLVQVDVTSFIMWTLAQSHHPEEADALRARFRPEFRPAFDHWLAEGHPGALPAGNPFTESEYQSAASRESKRLTAEAAASTVQAQRANQLSDDFIFAVVLFTSVGFFGSIQPKASRIVARRSLLLLSLAMFAFAIIFMLRLPQTVG